MDSIAQRREEILAKKAKLAELKKQRELRRAEGSNRQSLSGSPAKEVRSLLLCLGSSINRTHIDIVTNSTTKRR